VTVKPMGRALSAAPIGMLMSKQAPEKQFKIEDMDADGSNLEWFRLVPHKRDSDFTSMDVGVGNNGIQEMILSDKFKQQTYIKFNGIRTNGGIDASRFQFTPPAGADVVGKPS
jgi:outer membrane lipoprotein carrier protein